MAEPQRNEPADLSDNDRPQATVQRITGRNSRKISEAIGHSQDILYIASTVFPFTLFPDTVAVDREKVTVVNRTFFRTAEIVSIRIHDVLNVTADVGPFFGAVRIQTRFFESDIHHIKFLRREDALRLKRLLQGYVIAAQKEIDCDSFTAEELTKLLNEIGQGHPTYKDM